MDRAIEVWEGEGGAPGRVAAKVVQRTRQHRTWWMVVLYAITIFVVLAFAAKLH
jgi:hypothetical protein